MERYLDFADSLRYDCKPVVVVPVSFDQPDGAMMEMTEKQKEKTLRGFVMSLDALMAAITTIIMLAVVASILGSQSQENFKNEQMFSLATDTLSVMQETGSLNNYVTLGAGAVQTDMQNYLSLLPGQFCGNVTVRIYSSNGGGSFTQQNRYEGLTANCVKTNLTAQTSRIFVNYNPTRYGVADMTVWLR